MPPGHHTLTLCTRVNSPPISRFPRADWSCLFSINLEHFAINYNISIIYLMVQVEKWAVDGEHVVGLVGRQLAHGGHCYAHVEAGRVPGQVWDCLLSTAGCNHIVMEAIRHQPRHRKYENIICKRHCWDFSTISISLQLLHHPPSGKIGGKCCKMCCEKVPWMLGWKIWHYFYRLSLEIRVPIFYNLLLLVIDGHIRTFFIHTFLLESSWSTVSLHIWV